MGVGGGQFPAPATSNPGKDPVPILQEAGWASGPAWTGRKSRPNQDSISDRLARSQSLYRLSYPAHSLHCSITLIKPLTELCLTVFYVYFIILHDTTGMSHLKVTYITYKSHISPKSHIYHLHCYCLQYSLFY